MTISTWLLILTFAVGAEIGQPTESTLTSAEAVRQGKIAGECYINGIWYNPCPTTTTYPGTNPGRTQQLPN